MKIFLNAYGKGIGKYLMVKMLISHTGMSGSLSLSSHSGVVSCSGRFLCLKHFSQPISLNNIIPSCVVPFEYTLSYTHHSFSL